MFAQVVPEVAPLFDYDQNNPHHDADGWRHTARVVAQVEPTPTLRLAAPAPRRGQARLLHPGPPGDFPFLWP